MARWTEMFYCPRCDSVFIPETGESAPVVQMDLLL